MVHIQKNLKKKKESKPLIQLMDFSYGPVAKTPVQGAQVRSLVQGTRSHAQQLKDPTCCN